MGLLNNALKRLSNANTHIRQAAAEALGQIGDAAAMPAASVSPRSSHRAIDRDQGVRSSPSCTI
jgi:HEAT repeat protein